MLEQPTASTAPGPAAKPSACRMQPQISGQVEDDGTAAAGAGVERQQVAVCRGPLSAGRPGSCASVRSGRMCDHRPRPELEGGAGAMRKPRVLVTSGDPGGVGPALI